MPQPRELLRYELSGFTIASEVPLAARMAESSTTPIDVTIVVEEPRDQPYQRPSEDVIAEHGVDGFTWYSICRVGERYVIRMPGIADFEINQELDRIVCIPTHAARAEVMPIVITGTVMAFIVTMRGVNVLHGSAVEFGGRALGFVGVSGQGKSTMAAIMCSAGAKLVTDDVLPIMIDPVAKSARCIRSGHEIRLREKSVSLAERFGDDASVRVTKDERHAVAPAFSDASMLEISALAIPMPVHDAGVVSARLLRAPEAVLALSRLDRIEGWRDRAHLASMFATVSHLVEIVPVFELRVPWGPPFATNLAADILQACELANGATASRTPS